MPRISVVVPTFNCAGFIGEALHSVLAQTCRDFRIIVVDDGSTDDTREQLQPFERDITYLHQANQGPSVARNLAARHADGEFIAYLDADDAWLPARLEKQVRFFDENPRAGMVHADTTVVDEGGMTLFKQFNVEHGRHGFHGDCLHELLQSSRVFMPTVMERLDFFHESGGFDTSIRYGEDYLRWIRIALSGRQIGYIEEPLARYRWRGNSLSKDPSRHAAMTESMLHVYETVQQEIARMQVADRMAAAIVHRKLFELHGDLAHHLRWTGERQGSMHHALQMARLSPLSPRALAEIGKSLMPGSVFRRVGRLRQQRPR